MLFRIVLALLLMAAPAASFLAAPQKPLVAGAAGLVIQKAEISGGMLVIAGTAPKAGTMVTVDGTAFRTVAAASRGSSWCSPDDRRTVLSTSRSASTPSPC